MKLFNNICHYIKLNKLTFFIVILIFFLGVVLGSYALIKLDVDKISALEDYTDKFFSVNVLNLSDRKSVFKHNLFENIKLITLIWLSGFYIFLIPVALIQMFFKGFRAGFTISYLIGIYGFKGITYSFFNYFLGNLVFLPLIILFTVHCIKNSVMKKKISLAKKYFPRYLITYAVCIVLSIILSLFDGYIITYVLKAVSAINI